MNQKKTGVLLVNLGTPDEPTRSAVHRYLKQFLLDRRVIDYPWFFRQILVRGLIAPLRSGSSAKLYQKLWTDNGSPLKFYGEAVEAGVQKELGEKFMVKLAMRYQNPSIESAIRYLLDKHVSEIVVFPLFPQYASATTGSVYEEVMRVLTEQESIPDVSFINSYYDHPDMIRLYADKARQYDIDLYDHFVFSFHGVPQRHLRRADRADHCLKKPGCCRTITEYNQFCYSAQCHETARLIADDLSIPEDKYTVCFQSRLGPEEWTKPYTSEVIMDRLKRGEKNLLVFSPAFVADCLETTIEIGYEYKEEFEDAGGERLDLVESLNDDPRWIKTIGSIVKEKVRV